MANLNQQNLATAYKLEHIREKHLHTSLFGTQTALAMKTKGFPMLASQNS
jgi:hypothetical protein